MVKCFTWLGPRLSLEDSSGQLMDPGAGARSVTGEPRKRERL